MNHSESQWIDVRSRSLWGGMSRSSNTLERQEQIVDAMIVVVARMGYESASIQEIARTAGITPGLVHYHFKSKLEVLVAMQSRIAHRHLHRIDRAMARAVDAPSRVAAFIDCHLARGAEEDPDALACWIALTAEALRLQVIRTQYDHTTREIVGRLQSAIVDGYNTGTLSRTHPGSGLHTDDASRAREVATGIFAAIQGYYALHGASPGLIPVGTAAGCVRAMTEGLLRVTLPTG